MHAYIHAYTSLLFIINKYINDKKDSNFVIIITLYVIFVAHILPS